MRKGLLSLALIATLFLPALAQANSFTYEFTGVLSSATGISGLAAGQSYVGSLTYSTDALQWVGSGGTVSFLSPMDLSITVGGTTYNLLGMGHLPSQYWVTSSGGGDGGSPLVTFSALWFGAGSMGTPEQYEEGLRLDLALSGATGVPTAFSYAYALGNGLDNATAVDMGLTGTVISSSPTPVPAAVWLLGTGLGALVWRRRKASASAA